LSLSLIGEFYLRDKPQPSEPPPSVVAALAPAPPPQGTLTRTKERSADPANILADLKSAFDRKDYIEAAGLALPLAEANNREAQFSTAWLFDTGRGVTQDDQKAV